MELFLSRAKQKSFVRKGFTEAKSALKEVMQTNIALIADDLIKQIMSSYNSAIPSQEINSAKNLKIRGTQKYKDELRNALSIISLDALDRARKEIPAKKNVRLSEWNEDRILLGEFERLPPKVQKKILNQSQLIIDTQAADLEKAIYFQFSSSVDSTDSPSILQSDLEESATDFIDGP